MSSCPLSSVSLVSNHGPTIKCCLGPSNTPLLSGLPRFSSVLGNLVGLFCEIGSTRLRQKTVCLARNVSNISGTIGGTLENYFMNPEAWNLQGYTGFVWVVSTITIQSHLLLTNFHRLRLARLYLGVLQTARDQDRTFTNSISSSPRTSSQKIQDYPD